MQEQFNLRFLLNIAENPGNIAWVRPDAAAVAIRLELVDAEG
jgi:hypothetical protein